MKNEGERAEVRGSAWECVGVRGEFCVSGFETVERVLRVGGCGVEKTREGGWEKSVGGGEKELGEGGEGAGRESGGVV